MKLADLSIHAWLTENAIKNEKGDLIDFRDHPYLFDIYRDKSKNLVVMKAAQVGMSVCEILKNLYDAKSNNMDILYTLPTDDEAKVFVGSSVNRIIANNPILLEWTQDKDSVEQKSVGGSRIYFRGTWGKRKAQSTPADRLVHDEIDTSKGDVIAAYQARLQHSKLAQTHVFSHPSFPDITTDMFWKLSDQKHWFVECKSCGEWDYLSWNMKDEREMSVCLERRVFVCKHCRGELKDMNRRRGQWVAKYPSRTEWSGYWVPLLVAPYISADYIIKKYEDGKISPFEFSTKVLGQPHNDGSAKLLLSHFTQNLTGSQWAPTKNERVVMGVDTGIKLDYVLGNVKGLFHHGEAEDYDELDALMERWPKMIAVVDGGGDLIGSRKFKARWPGRVFLCFMAGDKQTEELVDWGKKNESGTARGDRNRLIQLLVDEFRDKRIPVHGTEDDWYEYYLDWNNLSRIDVIDQETGAKKGHKWVRSGRDHRALATVNWRVGMMRFGATGSIVGAEGPKKRPDSYMVEPDQTAKFNPEDLFDAQDEEDWRL